MQDYKNQLPLPKNNKDLGQHFLTQLSTILQICDSFQVNKESHGIIEVGPGPGALTEHLSRKDAVFHVIEKDPRMQEFLQAFLKPEQMHFTDALALTMDEFIAQYFGGKKIWLVSNLPYNVGSPLFVKFLQVAAIDQMTLMFQAEVADKIVPFKTLKNEMNSLMALGQNYFETQLLLKVPPGHFSPPPKVDSAVITLKRRLNPAVPLKEFKSYEKFLRLAFSQKRKQLMGILKAQYKKEQLEATFSKLQLLNTVRAEALSLEQVQQMYLLLTHKE